MSSVIQIKRTQNSALPSSLNFGELLYHEASGSLYIGRHDGSLQLLSDPNGIQEAIDTLQDSIPSQLGDLPGDLDADRVVNAATAAQASFAGITIVCGGDSQARGSTVDDLTTQPWPALLQKALPAATVINRGIHAANSAAILGDLQANVSSPSTKSFVLMWGRNDANQSVPLATLQANTQTVVTWFGSNRYILVTIPYEDDVAASAPDTIAYVDQYNNWIKSTFPGHVLDLNAIYEANADPANAGDTADALAKITPRSLRNDYVHANAAGHAIQAEAILQMISVLAPDPQPVLEPKSQANALGNSMIRAAVNRINVWQRLQKFIAGFRSIGVGSAIGDGSGFAVGGILAGVDNRWFGILKFSGVPAAIVRALGQTIPFSVSSSASDVADTSATRTKELEWGDNGFRYYVPVQMLDDNTGVIVGSMVGVTQHRTLGMAKVAGSSGAFIKASGATVDFYHSSSTTDVLAGTRTSDMRWSDNLFTYTSLIHCNGDGYGMVVGSGNSRAYAIQKIGGASGAHIRQLAGTIRFRVSDGPDATTGVMTDEMVWDNAGFKYNVDTFVQGESRVLAVGASVSTMGLAKKAGAGPKLVTAFGTDFIVAEASTTSLVGNINSATLTERFKVAASTGAVSFSGSLAVGGGAALTKILPASASLDFPEIAAGASTSLTISVTGAVAGSSVAFGPPSGGIEAGLRIETPEAITDGVKVTLTNTTGAPIDPDPATYKCVVFNP